MGRDDLADRDIIRSASEMIYIIDKPFSPSWRSSSEIAFFLILSDDPLCW